MWPRSQSRTAAAIEAAAYLAHCTPQAAYDWLATRPVEFSGVFSTPRTSPDAHLLEYILLRRREPLIQLGLAKYGRSRTILRRLYKATSGTVRAAVCGNASLIAGDDLEGIPPLDPTRPSQPTDINPLDILQNGSEAEVVSLCSAAHLPSPIYDAALNIALAVPEKRGVLIIRTLTENPRLRTPRSESPEADYLDGFAEYDYNRVFFTAWGLAESAPITMGWAAALANLFAKLPRGYKPNSDVKAAIARWRNFPEGVDPAKDHSPASYVREGLARNLKPELAMLDDPDPAIRRAFYGGFDPNVRECRDLDWTSWLDRDPHSAMIALEGNDRVWRTAASRQKLFELLREDARRRSDYVHVGWARTREDEYRKKHPAWFSDEGPLDDAPASTQDLIERIDVLEQSLTQRFVAIKPRGGPGVWSVIGVIVLLVVAYTLGRGSAY